MMYTRQYISSPVCKHVKFQKLKKFVIFAIANRTACCIPDNRVDINPRENLFPSPRCHRVRRSSSVASGFKVSRDNVLKNALTLTPSNELIHEFVFKNIDRWAQKTALVCTVTDRSYTYLQLYDLSHKFATSLRKNKLHKGSTIAVILPNIPEYPIIILGAAIAGLKVTTINPISTTYEISRQLKNSDARAVVTLPELNAVVQESISDNPNIIMPVMLVDIFQDSMPANTVRFSELVSDSVERFDKTETTNGSIEDTLFIPYSSGTTGLPKGVELSHRNIVANCRQIQTPDFNPANETTATHQEVVPVILPAFHIYGLVVVVLNYLSIGAKLAFLPKFNPEGVLKCLQQYKSTLLYAAPPMILFFGNSPLVTARHLDSIKFVMSGAAPLGVNTVQRFLGKADHEIVFSQGWGLSETSPVITTSNNCLGNLDAAGFVVPSTELRVVGVDDHNVGKNVGFGESGELYVKGPQVMKGYYKNPEATANAMDGEWFKTGDIGFYSETGHVTIKDRIKELIKVKGFQVAPAELEELLRSNEDITDAGVIAEEHPDFGEIPKAFIVRRPGAKISADQVKKFVADRVAKYKQLGTVKFIDSIPKSTAGKILRRELRNL